MTNPFAASAGTISSVEHAISVIELLSSQGAATVSEIARATGLPRPTVYRLLNTLEARRITAKDGKRHALTLRLYELGVTARALDQLQLRVQPILDRIVAVTGLTAHFAIRDEDTAAFVAKRDAPGAMPMVSRIGWRGPLHCTAVGKVLLAETGLPEDLALVAQTSRTLTDPAHLAEAVKQAHRDGFAIDDEELLPGLRCVAVPWQDGRTLLGAISVSGRTADLKDPADLAAAMRSTMTSRILSVS